VTQCIIAFQSGKNMRINILEEKKTPKNAGIFSKYLVGMREREKKRVFDQ